MEAYIHVREASARADAGALEQTCARAESDHGTTALGAGEERAQRAGVAECAESSAPADPAAARATP